MKNGQYVTASKDITRDIVFGDGGKEVLVPDGTPGIITSVGEDDYAGLAVVMFENGHTITLVAIGEDATITFPDGEALS